MVAKKLTPAQLSALRRGIDLPDGRIMKLIDPMKLRVDPAYQRGLVMSSVDRIRREFDEEALGIFQVGQRVKTKEYNVFDAQHRLAAIKIRKSDGDPVPSEVLCCVTPNTTQEQEAKLFVMFNTNKPVTGNNKFRARLIQSDAQPEQTIQDWVNEERFELCFLSPGRPTDDNVPSNGIYSVASLLKGYNTCGPHLKSAIRLLRLVWGKGNAHMVPVTCRTGQVVLAIAMFLRGQGDKDIMGIARRFQGINLDLTMLWDDIKRTEGHGFDRSKTLASRLTMFASGRV